MAAVELEQSAEAALAFDWPSASVAGGFDPWNGTNRAELLVLPNGDIIAAGNYIGDNAQGIGNWNGVPQEWLLEEFTANGQPVASFGQNGAMYVNIGGGASECDDANAMALTANGELLVGGAVFRNVNNSWTAYWTLAAFSTGMTTTRQWYQHDANFNVTSIADSNGNVIQRYVYTPYGQQTVLNADWSVPTTPVANSVYGFQGGRYDAATGLIHFGEPEATDLPGRDDESTGTWLEADPDGYINGVNTHQVELSSPIDHVDPTGLDTRSTALPVPIISLPQWQVTYNGPIVAGNNYYFNNTYVPSNAGWSRSDQRGDWQDGQGYVDTQFNLLVPPADLPLSPQGLMALVDIVAFDVYAAAHEINSAAYIYSLYSNNPPDVAAEQMRAHFGRSAEYEKSSLYDMYSLLNDAAINLGLPQRTLKKFTDELNRDKPSDCKVGQ